jgi:protein AroM
MHKRAPACISHVVFGRAAEKNAQLALNHSLFFVLNAYTAGRYLRKILSLARNLLMNNTSFPRLGVITIGQSPRADLTADLPVMLGEQVTIIERGILDAFTLEEVNRRYPVGEQRPFLVSRMRNGDQVEIAEQDAEPLLDACINIMAEQDNVDVILVLCTGDLPQYPHLRCQVLSPKHIVRHFFAGINPPGKLIVMSPSAGQIANTRERWAQAGREIDSLSASPYQDQAALIAAGKQAVSLAGSLIYLDCMGYTLAHRQAIAEASGKRVIAARQVVFSAARLLLGS